MPRVEFKTKKEKWTSRLFVNGPLNGTSQDQPVKKKKFTEYEYPKVVPTEIVLLPNQRLVLEHVYKLIGDRFELTEVTNIIREY